ncbi:hypothetical protein ACJX0J_010675, partial [Zea mays]
SLPLAPCLIPCALFLLDMLCLEGEEPTEDHNLKSTQRKLDQKHKFSLLKVQQQFLSQHFKDMELITLILLFQYIHNVGMENGFAVFGKQATLKNLGVFQVKLP